MDLTAAWESAERVLCIRLDGIGDVLMTTPAIRALKQSRPGRRITLLTSPAGAEVARLVPEIDDVLTYDAPWMKATAPRVDSHSDQAFIERLRRLRFDAAAIFTVYSQSPLPAALLCYLADIPLRLGHCRERSYQLLTHAVPEIEPERTIRHEVRRQLDLVATVGCRTDDVRLSLEVPRPAIWRVQLLLDALGVAGQEPWAVIHPGASAPSRRYPATAYAEVARLLTVEHGWQLVLTGGEDEINLVGTIHADIDTARAHSLAGRLGLAELAALLSLAPVVITNNTGPAHIATALRRPVVDLYAQTNPQHTPWLTPSRVLFHEVPCRNCYMSICPEGHHHCLSLVSPETVVAAALDLARAASADPAEPTAALATGGRH